MLKSVLELKHWLEANGFSPETVKVTVAVSDKSTQDRMQRVLARETGLNRYPWLPEPEVSTIYGIPFHIVCDKPLTSEEILKRAMDALNTPYRREAYSRAYADMVIHGTGYVFTPSAPYPKGTTIRLPDGQEWVRV